ncbi:MAG: transcriptional regulator NrdR, partial [Clostridia bacterium]
MKCMSCGSFDSKVIDSRLSEDGTCIKRRRECNNCGKRYTTYETIEINQIMVIKKSGNRQTFSKQKLKQGILKACEKRPVPMQKIDDLVDSIEKKLSNSLEQEFYSKDIGDMVMEGLKDIDEVA